MKNNLLDLLLLVADDKMIAGLLKVVKDNKSRSKGNEKSYDEINRHINSLKKFIS